MDMQIVLLERVPKLGAIGDVVTVKPGYARNFLLPKKKALRATPENLEYFSVRRAEIEENNLTLKKGAEATAEKLTDTLIVVIRQASESGFLYGSVRSSDIVVELEKQGYIINKSQVQIKAPIKTIGTYRIGIVLHPEVISEISLRVMTAQEQQVVSIEAATEEPPQETV
ncbi:MAG: 50S ribosomal protein L9 [Holosporales bacterium]|nr:50S ribosomal protein L9 [Holosporales bacterium]